MARKIKNPSGKRISSATVAERNKRELDAHVRDANRRAAKLVQTPGFRTASKKGKKILAVSKASGSNLARKLVTGTFKRKKKT